jgi:hypothetical protein
MTLIVSIEEKLYGTGMAHVTLRTKRKHTLWDIYSQNPKFSIQISEITILK